MTTHGPFTVRRWLNAADPGAVVLQGSEQVLSTTSDAQTETLIAGLQATIGTPTPPPSQFVAPALPSVPASYLPSSSLHVIAADCFAPVTAGGVAIGSAQSTWGCLDSSGGFNSNEVEFFAPGAVAVAEDGGCVLTATPAGTWPAGPNAGVMKVQAGCIYSTPDTGLGGGPGNPIKGGLWLPVPGEWIFQEFEITIPGLGDGNNGMDLGLWNSGPKGQDEIDDAELMDMLGSNPLGVQAIWNVINHLTGQGSPNEYYDANLAVQQNGGRVRFTTAVNPGVSQAAFLTLLNDDGTEASAPQYVGDEAWSPNGIPSEPMAVIISQAYRNGSESWQHPTFTDSKVVTVWRHQMWCTDPTEGTLTAGVDGTIIGGCYVGFGIAPGTTVATS